MKYTTSLTDDDGITVSLSVAVDSSAFSRLSGDSTPGGTIEGFPESFLATLPEMTEALRQARAKVVKSLLVSASESLLENLFEMDGQR